MTKFYYHEDGTQPYSAVFVFGSNLAGRHGAGAAKAAMDKFGARYGVGIGFTGQSYAIPTKDYKIETLPFEAVKFFIGQFAQVSHALRETEFFITRVGCGLAGFTDDQIAPLFRECNAQNCSMPEPWKEFLE